VCELCVCVCVLFSPCLSTFFSLLYFLADLYDIVAKADVTKKFIECKELLRILYAVKQTAFYVRACYPALYDNLSGSLGWENGDKEVNEKDSANDRGMTRVVVTQQANSQRDPNITASNKARPYKGDLHD